MFLINKMKFPIRTFGEMFTKEEFRKHIEENITNKIVYTWSNDEYKILIKPLIENIYAKYKDRYPIEQNSDRLLDYIYITFSQFYPTFTSRLWGVFYQKKSNKTFIENPEFFLQSTESENIDESGTSTAPYGLNYSALSPDFLDKQKFSEKTSTISKNKSFRPILSTLNTAGRVRITGEMETFTNTFYKLFSDLNLDDFVDNALSIYINQHKKIINNLILNYNNLMKKLDKMKITYKQ